MKRILLLYIFILSLYSITAQRTQQPTGIFPVSKCHISTDGVPQPFYQIIAKQTRNSARDTAVILGTYLPNGQAYTIPATGTISLDCSTDELQLIAKCATLSDGTQYSYTDLVKVLSNGTIEVVQTFTADGIDTFDVPLDPVPVTFTQSGTNLSITGTTIDYNRVTTETGGNILVSKLTSQQLPSSGTFEFSFNAPNPAGGFYVIIDDAPATAQTFAGIRAVADFSMEFLYPNTIPALRTYFGNDFLPTGGTQTYAANDLIEFTVSSTRLIIKKNGTEIVNEPSLLTRGAKYLTLVSDDTDGGGNNPAAYAVSNFDFKIDPMISVGDCPAMDAMPYTASTQKSRNLVTTTGLTIPEGAKYIYIMNNDLVNPISIGTDTIPPQLSVTFEAWANEIDFKYEYVGEKVINNPDGVEVIIHVAYPLSSAIDPTTF